MSNFNSLRFRSLLALAGALTVWFFAAVPHASAAAVQRCSFDSSFNACLTLEPQGHGWYHAKVGLDVNRMPAQYASEILGCGPNLQASLWGDDGTSSADDFLAGLPIEAGWPVLTPGGFAVEFDQLYLPPGTLDEDDGTDEVYARVTYWDCHTRQTVSYRSGTVTGSF